MKKTTLLSLAAATLLFVACGEESKKAVAEATAKTTEVVKETTVQAVDAVKKAAEDATEEAKIKAAEVKVSVEKKAADAAQALKDRAAATTEAAKEKATEVVEATKEVATETVEAVKEAVSPTADNAAGEAAYAKCAGCHGKDGKTKALGKSEVVAGQSAADLETKLAEYKVGTRNVSGMGMLMKGQVTSMSDEDMKAVSEYMSAM